MKVAVVQPPYSTRAREMEEYFAKYLALCDECDDTMDLIVFPEYCDVPVAAENGEAFHAAIRKHHDDIFEKMRQTAIRCHALVFANFADLTETGARNTTFAFDREGNVIGKYYKAHPTNHEIPPTGSGMDGAYSYRYQPTYILEHEGLRFAFLTCYDFYMYEMFPAIARQKPDIIIGCSHQRTDTHETLETIGKFLCYNTNAYLVRASVTLGEDSPVCGCSMVASPEGKLLVNMKSGTGIAVCDIDPHKKHLKRAGFHGAVKSHPEYIEDGRRPWLYRPAGSMMTPPDGVLGYPRICAHRGFNSAAPENTLPAFGAAVALGADEIEFDLWTTSDGMLVSLHDSTLDRVSNGTGKVYEHTYEELLALDFGVKRGAAFEGLPVVTFEEILRKFAGTVIMNIHVKIWDAETFDPKYEEIAGLIRKYDCEKTVYIMSRSDKCLAEFHTVAPEINRCVGMPNTEDYNEMVDRAIRLGAQKVQLVKPHFDRATVEYAHRNGIICNVFYADDPEEACRYIDMGIDTILTNDFLRVRNAVKKHLGK